MGTWREGRVGTWRDGRGGNKEREISRMDWSA